MFSLEVDNKSWTLRELYSMYKQGTLAMDIVIQRGQVWSSSQRSLYIHSALLGILGVQPPFVFSRNITHREDQSAKSTYNVLDGKQRLTALFEFIDGNYALTALNETTPITGSMVVPEYVEDNYHLGHAVVEYVEKTQTVSVNAIGVDFNKKKFDELSIFSEILMNTTLQCTVVVDPTLEQESLIFSRLNSGKPMAVMDRARASCKCAKAIEEFAMRHNQLFKIMYNEQQLLKKPEFEVIIKSLMMIDYSEIGLLKNCNMNSKACTLYAKSLAEDQDFTLLDKIYTRALNIFNSIESDESFSKELFITSRAVFLSYIPFLADDAIEDDTLIKSIKTVVTSKMNEFKSRNSHSPDAETVVHRNKIIGKTLK